MVEKRIAQRRVAVHGLQVIDDVDVEEVVRPRAPDPFLDAVVPRFETAAERRVPGHDAALAVGYAGDVESIGKLFAQRPEPAVFRTIRIAAREHDRIVLVWSQQAFAASARAEHQHGVLTGRRAVTFRLHGKFPEHGGAAGQRAQFLADDLGDDARVDRFGEQRAHDAGQCCPCSRQSGGVRGVLDPVVEVDRGGGAQLQQVTRRQNAHQRAGIVAHGKVANLQPVHAPDGAVGECSGADAGERPRGDGAGRHVQRSLAVAGNPPHHVAFGDDAVVADRSVRFSKIGYQQGADPARDHQVYDLPHGVAR